MRVYLDNCAYNRPFDDQENIIVRIETEAKLVIQQMVKDNVLSLIWSDVLDYENSDNPFEERRAKIGEWEAFASEKVELDDEIIEKARKYMEVYRMTSDTVLKRKGLDALSKTLGLVDAERFISLILRKPFDYTEWQRNLYNDVSLDEFYHNVQNFRGKNHS